MQCKICGDARLVLREPPTNHGTARVRARMPVTVVVPVHSAACNVCDHENPPEMPPGYGTILDKDGWKN